MRENQNSQLLGSSSSGLFFICKVFDLLESWPRSSAPWADTEDLVVPVLSTQAPWLTFASFGNVCSPKEMWKKYFGVLLFYLYAKVLAEVALLIKEVE